MKIGFACGVFDLFHAGHVMMLEECKEHCEYLIVAVNAAENIDASINPNKRAPVYSLDERVMIMKSIKYVDRVLIYRSESELLQIMKENKIDVRFLGDDYRDRPITGSELNIPIYYTNRSHGLSTTEYRKRLEGRE
jgi:glycerol-3-phosphate cytidylyltransferase